MPAPVGIYRSRTHNNRAEDIGPLTRRPRSRRVADEGGPRRGGVLSIGPAHWSECCARESRDGSPPHFPRPALRNAWRHLVCRRGAARLQKKGSAAASPSGDLIRIRSGHFPSRRRALVARRSARPLSPRIPRSADSASECRLQRWCSDFSIKRFRFRHPLAVSTSLALITSMPSGRTLLPSVRCLGTKSVSQRLNCPPVPRVPDISRRLYPLVRLDHCTKPVTRRTAAQSAIRRKSSRGKSGF